VSVSEHKHIRTIDPAATAACLGALVFWSLGPIFIKYLTGYLDSWTQNFLRYAVACCFWLPYLFYCARTKQLDHGTWKRAIIPAGANIIMQSLWAISFYLSGPAFMVLLTKTNIVWIALFSLILFPEERPLIRSRRFWLGLVLAATGVSGVLYFKVDLADVRTIKAVLIGLATAFMWGVYAVSVRAAFRNIDSRTGFSVISIYTCFGLGVLSLLFGDVQRSVHIGPWQWFCIVISGVTAIAVAHTLYYSAMRRLGATIPALVILAQPFAVLAISHAVFGESLNAYQVLFGLMLLFGAGLAIWAQQHLGRASRLAGSGQ
jgi:drug/metabolite transporter (DMT)-like permease